MFIGSKEGEICVMIDETDIPSKPYGVYTFVGNTTGGKIS